MVGVVVIPIYVLVERQTQLTRKNSCDNIGQNALVLPTEADKIKFPCPMQWEPILAQGLFPGWTLRQQQPLAIRVTTSTE